MRWLVFVGIVATSACTRLNPAYGDGGGTGGGSADDDDDDSVSDDAIATLDDDDASADDSNVDTGPDDGTETGSHSRPCCTPHSGLGCEDSTVQECVCSEVPECCEVDWHDHCAEKARNSCGADCGVVDDGPLDAGTSTTPMTSDESDSLTDSASAGSTSTSEGGSSTGGLGDSNCCVAHEDPGCDNDGATACVCEQMPDCCELGWSEPCVEAVAMCPTPCLL
jgi:hypothetical protein